jgi:hypothetical protein
MEGDHSESDDGEDADQEGTPRHRPFGRGKRLGLKLIWVLPHRLPVSPKLITENPSRK